MPIELKHPRPQFPEPPPPPLPFKPPVKPEHKQQAEVWQTKAADYMKQTEELERRHSEVTKRLEELMVPEPLTEKLGLTMDWTKLGTSRAVFRAQARLEIDTLFDQILTSSYYSSIYQGIPAYLSVAKAAGEEPDPDLVLALIGGAIPPGMTSSRYDELRQEVADMVEAILPAYETRPEPLPEMALEAEPLELPELEPPIQVAGVPVSINQLTIEEIRKALMTPLPPVSPLSREEFEEFLVTSGQISDKADLGKVEFYRDQARAMLDRWREQDNMLQAYREGVAVMPEHKAFDLLKEMVVMPGLGLLDMARFYFEHVSMPLAGAVYKTFIPDIEAAYQRYKQEESTWKALAHAWEEWDAPGDGAASWMLKYLLMEGLVDPLSYVGWGLGAKLVRPIPFIGRRLSAVVGGVERGVASVFELPFDMLKAGLRKLPKTLGQRATVAMHQAGQYTEAALTAMFGKALWQMSKEEMRKGVTKIIDYTLKHPQVDNELTRAGAQLLKHKPFDEQLVWRVAQRLNTTLSIEDITKRTVETVDRIFEDMFQTIAKRGRIITPRESAARLVAELSGTGDGVIEVAQKVLADRAKDIISHGMKFGATKNALKSVRALMRQNYRIYIKAEESAVALAQKEMGAMSTRLHQVPTKVAKVWSGSIDRWVVRPFAESYLAFALYGPMNVIEDIIRSGLGGVVPWARTYKAFTRKWYGTTYDQMLATAERGFSETFGALRRRNPGEVNNWILQIGGLAKGFGDKLYGALVEFPGRIGMGVRLHYIDAKATQILKEIGGEYFERLAKVATKFEGTGYKRINKEVNQVATELATMGAPRESFSAAAADFTRANILRREVDEILMQHPGLNRAVRDRIMQTFNDEAMFAQGAISINDMAREMSDLIVDDFLKSAEHAWEGYEGLARELTALEVRNPEEMAQLIRALNFMSTMQGATPRQIMGRAVEKSRGLPLAERRLTLDKTMDTITVFRERAGASTTRVTEHIRTQLPKVQSPQYVTDAERLFDLQTAKRLRASELGEQANAFRHEYFVDATKADMKNPDFWDDYAREISARWDTFDVSMAEFDSMIDNAIEDLNRLAGVAAPSRPPIKVKGQVSTNDIAMLIGCRGDDISRAILDVMVPQNSRNHFVAYVMGKVKPGDEGFTKESVGAVYDSLMNELVGGAQNASWVSGQRLELEAVRRDLHMLYNSKLLPDEEIANIGRYMDDVAGKVEDIMFDRPIRPVDVRMHEAVADLDIYGLMAKHNLKARVGGYTEPQPLSVAYNSYVIGMPEDFHPLVRAMADSAPFQRELRQRLVKAGLPEEFVVYRGRPIQAELAKDFTNITLDRKVAEVMSIFHPSKVGPEGWTVDQFVVRRSDILGIGRTTETELFLRTKNLRPFEVSKVVKPEYANYSTLKQQAMDEAHKWYYKEFTDYTNANAFDAILKAIYPFWTYESQRWFWLPRSFVRHPGTFTTFERWQDNTDYGYVHIPGTSIDINPFRGTIYGTLTTRLARRDFPEYYDSMDAAGDLLEFNDFLSRYGFYPGTHITAPIAIFGGAEMQFGEVQPALIKTPLDALIALLPDNESVRWISDRVFGDRFRNYLTILTVNRLGGNGSLIFSKQQENKPLTPEEEQFWSDARREVGWYSAGFEQFALFRMRTDEQTRMYQEAAKVIEEMTGFTPEQQDWLREHGYRLWDMIGGLSPSQQKVLEELGYYKYVGQVRPLLPGKQQDILNKIELAWNDVETYTTTILEKKLQLQRDLLSGARGSSDYNSGLLELYDDQRKYIDNKIEEYPLMALENRKDYYKEYGQEQPVLHPMKELANLFFFIELQETIDPETGEIVEDWDNFWAQRQAIEEAVPDDYKQEWQDFLTQNTTRIEEIRREVYSKYFRPYNMLWEEILSTYPEDEQRMVEEFLYLRKVNQQLDRQEQIQNTISSKTGNQLISSFQSEVSDARRALRYANPHLDAWLLYWGKVSKTIAPGADEYYQQIAKQTGRKV